MSRKKPAINEMDLMEGLTFSDTDSVPNQESISKSIPTSKNKYYTAHPKTGTKGGKLGRPLTNNPKISVSFTCTKDEKQLYKEAAKKDKRKFPDFIHVALEEYIERHNLN